MPESATPRAPAAGRRHLVLLGAGHAHLHLLTRLASHPEPGLQVSLVSMATRSFWPALLPLFVAGNAAWDDCAVALEPLLRRSGVQQLARRVAVLDAASQTVSLDDGRTLHYDWLSVDWGPEQERARLETALPGAREHGLFLCPAEGFSALWPQVVALAPERLRSLVVIGPGAQAMDIALALRYRLADSAVTFVTGGAPLGAGYPAGMARKIGEEFRRQRITVLVDRALGLHHGEVRLGCGARLACDVPLIAAGQAAPAWLTTSGLALGPDGQVMVDRSGRSASHGQVMLAPGCGTGAAAAATAGAFGARRSARHQAANILRVVHADAPRPATSWLPAYHVLAGGHGSAVAGWGGFSWRGRWLGRIHGKALAASLRGFRPTAS